MTLKVVPLVEFATPMMEPTGRETGTPTPGTPGTPDTEVTLAVTATGCASCSLVSAVASSVSLVNGSDMSGSTATLSDVWLSSISAVLASPRLLTPLAALARPRNGVGAYLTAQRRAVYPIHPICPYNDFSSICPRLEILGELYLTYVCGKVRIVFELEEFREKRYIYAVNFILIRATVVHIEDI